MTTFYVIKYALTKGILELEGKKTIHNNFVYFRKLHNHVEIKYCYSDKQSAIEEANEMKAKKIANLKDQLKKLKALEFK